MIALTFIVIGTSLLLITGIIDRLKDKKIYLLNLLGGVLLIIGSIILLAGFEIALPGFWSLCEAKPGLYLHFIGGGLGILTRVMGIMEKRSM
ncbi:MAG: hypothetical protein ACFFA4_00865 [Promethearchaeota archaeon]